MTNGTLREVWPWHSKSKTRKITRKNGLLYKLIFMLVNNQNYLQTFLNTNEITKFEKVLGKAVLHKIVTLKMEWNPYHWVQVFFHEVEHKI